MVIEFKFELHPEVVLAILALWLHLPQLPL
ncbi:hypothetical protein FB443_1011017 [Vibrio crassostreae]|nr:hypothetical protein FORC14_1874 [Vibrio parahaemolyticus]ROR87534.1 hypothetical protein EDB66_0466 [Vibrio crassostreae]ROR87537.1 hypothetical protein EDB66_0469 [Vibrio crassostreae]TQL46070.1 hypothetical protein FB443_1011014 [Vibrio crassostreae]TQL46073.1 hypothetical protein FB443_1011017 [Vibrio crassostreae]